MKRLMLALALVAMIGLSGCFPHQELADKENGGCQHEWGKWTNDWKETTDEGYMQQHRTCEKCGFIQTEWHK